MSAISHPASGVALAQDNAARASRWGLGHKLAAGLVSAGAIVGLALLMPPPAVAIDSAMAALGLGRDAAIAAPAINAAEAEVVAAMTVDDKSQIVAEGATAQERNAAIPLATGPVEVAKGFVLASLAKAEMPTALKCLTQAVYYEAAFEPLTGRRAVAQVVLNRMRHPAYPKSVCGVVYQGSERRTGCQFSFTCDGALLRAPATHAWREAEAVARAALAGYVEPSVGTATHYHADYVLPKWAFNLGKIDQVGRHIFYRFNGGMGRPAAFRGRYAGNEHIPLLDVLALRERLAETSLPAETTPGLTVAPHVTDRHAVNDVGGRIDTTKAWRLEIPDPTAASSRYRSLADEETAPAARVAAADVPDVAGPARTMKANQP